MSDHISFHQPDQPGDTDKVQPATSEPVKAPAKKAAPKPDKYKPYKL